MNIRCLSITICLVILCGTSATAQRSKTGVKAYEQLNSAFNSASDASGAARRQPPGGFKAPRPAPIPTPPPQATWKPGATPPGQVDLNSLRRPTPAPAPPLKANPSPPPAVKPGGQTASVSDSSRQSANALNDLKKTDTTKLGMRAKQDHGAQVRKAEENLATSRGAVQRSNAEADALKKKKQNTDFATEKKRLEGNTNETKRLDEKKSQEKKTADTKRLNEKRSQNNQPGIEGRGTRPAPGTRVKPDGVPESWRVRPTTGVGGVEYYNPRNPNQSIRVMQGNPNSPHPNSRGPYGRQRDKSGTYLRSDGTPSPMSKGGRYDSDAHVPLRDFKVTPE